MKTRSRKTFLSRREKQEKKKGGREKRVQSVNVWSGAWQENRTIPASERDKQRYMHKHTDEKRQREWKTINIGSLFVCEKIKGK